MKDTPLNKENPTFTNIEKVKKDRMRFTKNRLPANLTLLAILVNVFYFVSIYKSNVTSYYKPVIGISIVYNLMFMLACFLCSEGIKNYKKDYGVALIVIGALQFLRIIYYPLKGHTTVVPSGGDKLVMETSQFIRVVIYLVTSGALLISAGIVGIVRSKTLQKYRMEIGEEKPS